MDKGAPITGRCRVLIILHHMALPGGAMNYTLRLAENLVRQGADVAILTMRSDPQLFRKPGGVEIISLEGPITSSLAFWAFFPYWQHKFNQAIAAWQPDVIVPQVFPANWWGWLYKRRHPETRLAWVCHEPSAFIHSMAWIRALHPWWKSHLARILRPVLAGIDVALVQYSDRIIANSRFTGVELKRVYGLVADGIAYPGIDFPAYACDNWQKERAIITVARLTKFKRVDFLLQVFKEVLKVHPELTYHIVGTGDEEKTLRELARQLGVADRVVFHGAATDAALVELYRRSSLFLHGSIDEPFGMTPLEAIACGTPVVAHKSGGPMEFVTTECGRLVDSKEVTDWAREIVVYLDDLFAQPEFPARVRECARRFDWPQALGPAVEVILGLCGASAGQSVAHKLKKGSHT